MTQEKIEISENLFAHINNDPFLTGAYGLEGQRHITTVGYLNQYIQSLIDSKQKVSDDVLRLLGNCNTLIEMEKAIAQIDNPSIAKNKTAIKDLATTWYEALALGLQNPQDYLLFPGGWRDKEGGHAIIYQFHKDKNGDLIFTINNSGAGLEYHPKRSVADKEMYSPTLQYRIPKAKLGDKKSFIPVLQSLLEAQFHHLHDDFDAKDLYETTFAKLSFVDASIEQPPTSVKDYIYTGGQLSGTCAQRSVHQMLKSQFASLDDYRRFIFRFKAHALKDYMEQLRKSGDLGNPQKQGQVEKAIRHQLRLLNVDKEGVKGEALFTGKYRYQCEQELREYLAILRKERVPLQQKAKAVPANQPKRLYDVDLYVQVVPDHSQSGAISRPVLADVYPKPKGGDQLISEMEQALDTCRRLSNISSQPEASFEILEQFFLSLPLPEERHSPLLPFYKSTSTDPKKAQRFYELMADLQEEYFKTGKTVLGNGVMPPRMMAIKASNFAVLGHVARTARAPLLTGDFHHIIDRLPTGLSTQNKLVAQLANHHPDLDKRLQKVREIYPETFDYGAMFPSSMQNDMIAHYSKIIHQFPELETKLKQGFETRYGSQSGPEVRKVRTKNCEALYYYLKVAQNDNLYLPIQDAFRKQQILEYAFAAGLRQFNGTYEIRHRDFSFSYDKNKDTLEMNSVILDGWNLFLILNPLMDTLYQLPEGPVKRCLEYYANQHTSANKITSISGPPSSSKVQLKQWSDKTSDLNDKLVGPEDIEERELFHLRHQPEAQIILTLEYFLKHPEKLSRYDMQVYCEANIFQPGLLVELLTKGHQEDFWPLLQRFMEQGIEASEKKGELSQQSIFYVRMYQSIIQYAYEMDPVAFKQHHENFKHHINLWINEPQQPEQLAHLHHYRFLMLNAQLQSGKALNAKETKELIQSYFVMNQNPLPPECKDADAAYRVERAKKSFMHSLKKNPDLLPWKDILAELESLKIIPGEDQRQSSSQFISPNIYFFDKQGHKFIIDIQQGLVLRDNMAFTYTPSNILNHPIIRHLGLEDARQCWQTADKEQFIIDKPPVKLRFTVKDPSYIVEQQFEVSKGQRVWHQLMASSTAQREYLNLNYSNVLNQTLPPVLSERLNFMWAAPQRDSLLITGANNEVLYRAKESTLPSAYKSQWQIQDTKGNTLFLSHPPVESLLSGIESSDYLLVSEDDKKNLSIQLPRYDLTLTKPSGQDTLFLQWDGKDYALDEEQSLELDGIAGLHFADRTLCVLPIVQYLATTERDPVSEYFKFSADTGNTVATDIVKRKPEESDQRFEKPEVWQHSQSRQAMVLKMQNGEPYPETPAQALYLCYVYLASHQEEKALAMLEACDKRLGGLEGRPEEVQYIRWICQSLPYQVEKNQATKKATISTPPVVACQLKAMSLLTEFSKRGQKINFPETETNPATPDAYVRTKTIQADQRFYDSGINQTIYQQYQRYQLMRRDMPVEYLLSESESRSLLNFYHDRLGSTNNDEPKAIGALGYDWVRLNFMNLTRELNHIQQKELGKIKLSDFEINRKKMITAFLKKHEGVHKRQSELESAPIDLDIGYHMELSNCSIAYDSFIKVFTPDAYGRNLKPLENQYGSVIEALAPDMSDAEFSKNFAVYLAIAMSNDLPERNALENYCKAVLRANRHVSVDKQPGHIPYLCNALYRVICEKKQYSYSTNLHHNFDTAAKFSTWVRNLNPAPIDILQLKDSTKGLLASTDAVLQSIPNQQPVIPPTVSLQQRDVVKKLALFGDKDLPSILSERKTWQTLEHQFYTGRKKVLLTESIRKLADSDAGENRLTALTGMREIARRLFNRPEVLEQIHQKTNQRIDALAKDQTTTESLLLKLANQGPEEKEHKLRWDIDIAAEKRKPININQLLALYFKADRVRYKEVTGLKDENIDQLHGQIAEFIQRGLLLQQLNRIHGETTKLQKQPFETLTDAALFKLGQQLFAPNLMSIFNDPALSVFQFHENILLRPHQQDGIRELLDRDANGHYQEVVEKIVMGGGKSKVLSPNVAFHKANGDNLVIIEVPRALLRTNYVDLKAMSADLYGQSAVLFEFSRDTDSSSKALKALFRQFSDVMVNKNYIVTTGESMQSLELKYLELLASPPDESKIAEFQEWKEQVFWAENLVLMVKNRGDCLIDEVHQGLLLKNRLNYTIGASKALPKFVRDNIVELYQFFKEVPLDGVGGLENQKLTMASLLQSYKPIKTKEQYQQACQALVSALLEHPKSPLLAGIRQSGKTLKESDIPEFTNYLFDKSDSIPGFIKDYPEDLQDLIALYKEEANHLLPFTLSRNSNEHYGPSRNPLKTVDQKAVAIPYRANNSPNEQSNFGNEIESINYTIQSMMINGVTENLLKQYLQFILQQAKAEAKENNKDSINDTAPGNLYKVMTKDMLLSELDIENPKQMRQLHDSMAHNEQLIFEVLKNNVLKNIRMNTKVLSSNALGHVDMMNTVQAFSGTPWNASTYHQRLNYKRELAFGTDEYIIQSLHKKDTPVIGIDFSNPDKLIPNLFALYKDKAQGELRDIIDISAAFKGISNEQVARQIATYIHQHPEQFNHPKAVKFVLFFDEKDQLSALPVDKPDKLSNIITIGSSNPEVIAQRLGCSPEERFSYYDQAHTLGTDIRQSDRAKGIVLCDQDTGISPFLQGVLRNRDVLDGQQSVDVYIPNEMAKGQSLLDLCEGMKKQEEAQLRLDNYLSTHYKMNNLIRQDFLKRILACNEGPEMKAALFKLYQHHFIEQQSERLFDRFGGIAKLEDTRLLLENHQKQLMKSWEELLQKSNVKMTIEEKSTLSSNMAIIIDKACKKGVCDEKQLSPSKTEAMEVELFTEVEKEEERLTEQYDPSSIPTNYTPWHYGNDSLEFLTLKQICQSAKPDYLPDFSDDIVASKNFYKIYNYQKNYLGMFMMPVHALYFVQEGEKITCTLLSPMELADAKKRLKQGVGYHSWISTPNHHVLAGNMPKDIKQNGQYQKIIEQVRFFNGDLGQLLERDAPLTWLTDDSKQKLDFFENYLAPGREAQATHIQQLRMGVQVQFKMLQFVAQNPQRDLRHFDWQKHYPTAEESDIKDLKAVADAFYEITGAWWHNRTTAVTLADKYHLSTTALGYLAQYEDSLRKSKSLENLKKLIIALDNEAFEDSQATINYQQFNPLLAAFASGGKPEITEALEAFPEIPREYIEINTDWHITNFYSSKEKTLPWVSPDPEMTLPLLLAKSKFIDEKQYQSLVQLSENNPSLAFALLQQPNQGWVKANLETIMQAITTQPDERIEKELLKLTQMNDEIGILAVGTIAKAFPPEQQTRFYRYLIDNKVSDKVHGEIFKQNTDDKIFKFYLNDYPGFYRIPYDAVRSKLDLIKPSDGALLEQISRINWDDERFIPDLLEHPARTDFVLKNLATYCKTQEQLLNLVDMKNVSILNYGVLDNVVTNPISKSPEVEWAIMQAAIAKDTPKTTLPELMLHELLTRHEPVSFKLLKNVFQQMPIKADYEPYLFKPIYDLKTLDSETLAVFLLNCRKDNNRFFETLIILDAFHATSKQCLIDLWRSRKIYPIWHARILEHPKMDAEVLEALCQTKQLNHLWIDKILAIKKPELTEASYKYLAAQENIQQPQLKTILERTKNADVVLEIAKKATDPALLDALLLDAADDKVRLTVLGKNQFSYQTLSILLDKPNLSTNVLNLILSQASFSQMLFEKLIMQKQADALELGMLIPIITDATMINTLIKKWYDRLDANHIESLAKKDKIGPDAVGLLCEHPKFNFNSYVDVLSHQYADHEFDKILKTLMASKDFQTLTEMLFVRSRQRKTIFIKATQHLLQDATLDPSHIHTLSGLRGLPEALMADLIKHQGISAQDINTIIRNIPSDNPSKEIQALDTAISALLDTNQFAHLTEENLSRIIANPNVIQNCLETIAVLPHLTNSVIANLLISHPTNEKLLLRLFSRDDIDGYIIPVLKGAHPDEFMTALETVALSREAKGELLDRIAHYPNLSDTCLSYIIKHPHTKAETLSFMIGEVKNSQHIDLIIDRLDKQGDNTKAIDLLLKSPFLSSTHMKRLLDDFSLNKGQRELIHNHPLCNTQVLATLIDSAEDEQQLLKCFENNAYSELLAKPLIVKATRLQCESMLLDKMCGIAQTSSELKSLLVLSADTNIILSEDLYTQIALHPACDDNILSQLEKMNVSNANKLKIHVQAYLNHHELLKHLEALKDLGEQLKKSPDKQEEAANAALSLHKDLSTAVDALIRKDGLIDANKISQFQKACVDAFNYNDKERIKALQTHPGTWFKVSLVLRAILGVIALITVIPAVVVQARSQHGFVKTFFATPETDGAKQLKAIQDEFEAIDKPKPQRKQ
ncbi:DUF3638 domain-containing protein [Legionella sp. W05-934-2]|uniref:DUF3638 domain-containing protein n=1 Tax=Legionella sp. W05-934-2 TaxID=1198649 RepID=UPI003462B124